jgi:deoxyribonuclease-4
MANSLRIAVAGMPLTTPQSGTILDGLKRTHELGIKAMELEWVHGVRMNEERAESIKQIANDLDISLTVHGPYYINLAAKEPEKLEASKKRVYDTAYYGFLAGAKSVTFHAGFYMGRNEKEVYDIIFSSLKEVLEQLNNEGIMIDVRPELTGKATQFGSLQELVRLSQEFEGRIKPCIDFAHQHARHGGGWGTYDKYIEVLEILEAGLGSEILQDLHMHFSGINYSAKGERNHLPFVEADNNYRDLLKALKEKHVGGQLVIESPVMEEDVLMAMKEYDSL